MDRGTWQATVCGVTKVRPALATTPPPGTEGQNPSYLEWGVYLLHWWGDSGWGLVTRKINPMSSQPTVGQPDLREGHRPGDWTHLCDQGCNYTCSCNQIPTKSPVTQSLWSFQVGEHIDVLGGFDPKETLMMKYHSLTDCFYFVIWWIPVEVVRKNFFIIAGSWVKNPESQAIKLVFSLS